MAAIFFTLASLTMGQRMVSVKVSNDMTYFTDRYFSSGIDVEVFGHFASRLPFSKLLLPHHPDDRVYHALTLTHNMYTPSDTYTPEIQVGDHPYAAYLLLGVHKQQFSRRMKARIDSRLQVGWIGPMAGGKEFQNSIHACISIAEYVEGWHNQIDNDLCIQYGMSMEKGLFSSGWMEFNGYLETRMGAPHTDARSGLLVRTGLIEPFYLHPGPGSGKPFQVWLFCKGDVNFVYYDATLQGGLNNIDNPYTLDRIYPCYWHMAFGGTLICRGIRIELAQEVVSPRFEAMLWHRWAYLSLLVAI